LALIITAPFAGFDLPEFSVPSTGTQAAITRPAKDAALEVKVKKNKLDKSGYNLDTAFTNEEQIAAEKAAAAEKEADKKAGT
jgi:hypothetical protein